MLMIEFRPTVYYCKEAQMGFALRDRTLQFWKSTEKKQSMSSLCQTFKLPPLKPNVCFKKTRTMRSSYSQA